MKTYKDLLKEATPAPETKADDKKEMSSDVYEKVFSFLENNPFPDDDDLHKYTDKEKINTHSFEEVVYAIASSFIAGGRAKSKKITEKDVDAKELEMGIKVEHEHLTSEKDSKWGDKLTKIMAKRIALDHLAEMKNYYTELKKMESGK
jgi:hypothetical protein